MQVIINADDYGRDKKTTDAIADCFLQHKITSTTMMVVHEDCERASGIAREIGLPTGLHLCLDEGRPAADPAKITTLLDQQGNLRVTSKRLFSGKVRQGELFLELGAQIKKMDELGLRMTHLDSHHHLHCHPLVLPVFFMNRQRLPRLLKIRIPRNFEPGSRLKLYGMLKYSYKMSAKFLLGYFFKTADYFTSITSYLDNHTMQLEKILAAVPRRNSSIEIMCHPGELEQYSFLLKKIDLDHLASVKDINFIDYSRL